MSAACEEYIDLRREGPEKMLVVNGNLVAGDTLHTVFLTWGMYDAVKPVESAHLECYVNGKLVASTDKVTEPERFSYNANAIRFKAPFNAGDEVRIKVDAGDAHAEAGSLSLPMLLLSMPWTRHHSWRRTKEANWSISI